MSVSSRDIQNGRLRPRTREVRKLPRKGLVKRYLCTSAQNNTSLHEACWDSLLTLAAHYKAEILVASFTYATASRASAGQKKTAAEPVDTEEWWDERVEPYLCDRSVELAPGLVWCGELQILPTAVNPLSGLASYTGRASSIVPHTTFAVESVASPKNQGTKFMYTTGAVTLRNYIQKKAGMKAEFHHGYGAVIVEVCHDGTWWVRQLNADSEGVIYDLDMRVSEGKITRGHRPEAIVWGDIHTRQLEPDVRSLGWGAGGILDALRPKVQVLHDVLDFRSANHHDRKDPWKTYTKYVENGLNVAEEVAELAGFLDEAARPWCHTVIAAANHDEALLRWLKEADFREDPQNAEFMLEATTATYRAIKAGDKKFQPLKWAVDRAGLRKRVRWLHRDEDFIVCPGDLGGGVKVDMHGDKGANGAKGSLVTFAKTGMKTITGDSHQAGQRHGSMSVGVMGNLDQGYNVGLSAWSRTNALVYPNAKRSLFTIYRGRAWA